MTFCGSFDKRFYGDAKRKTIEGRSLKHTNIIHASVCLDILVFDQIGSSLRLTHGDHDRILNCYRKNEGWIKSCPISMTKPLISGLSNLAGKFSAGRRYFASIFTANFGARGAWSAERDKDNKSNDGYLNILNASV